MALKDGIFALLNANPDIRALSFSTGSFLDSGSEVRIYPGIIPEEAMLPAAAFVFVGGTAPGLNMAGSDGRASARIQFSATGDNYDDATLLLGVISTVLHGFKGQTPNGPIVQLSKQLNEPFDEFIAEARLYLRHCDFMITYEQ
jgi:hypothetical protein